VTMCDGITILLTAVASFISHILLLEYTTPQ